MAFRWLHSKCDVYNIRAPFSVVEIGPVYLRKTELLSKWEPESGFGMNCLDVTDVNMSQQLIFTGPT